MSIQTEGQSIGEGYPEEPFARPEREPVTRGMRCSSPDPWVHRSIGMRCSSCMWYVRKVSHAPAVNPTPVGRCRRHAPSMNGYPVVYDEDWCGDHKIDETKI